MNKDDKTTSIIFLINGINGALAWNAVLAAFDFFADSFTEYNTYSFMPVALFVGYIVVGVIYHFISNNFKYITLIAAGNWMVNIALAAILIASLYLDQTLFGFIVILLCSFAMGIGTNLSELTFCAMINYLSQDIVSIYTVGTALSGILINGIRMVITAVYGSDKSTKVPIIVYFIVAALINTINIFINVHFCRSKVYKDKIDLYLYRKDQEKEKKSLLGEQKLQQNEQIMIEQEKEEQKKKVGEKYLKQQHRIQNQNYFRTLYETSQVIYPYPHLILFGFVIFFTLFPGPMFSRNFEDLDTTWTNLTFNMVASIGGAIGKYLPGIHGTLNHKALVYVFFCTFYFFFPVTFMALDADRGDPLTDNNIFPFVVMFLLALVNGFIINGSFVMSFRVCPLEYKKYAGVLCSLFLELGIMFGTFTQIPYAYALGIN